VHGQEIQQDNLKSQIQSAIVDLETEIPQDFKVPALDTQLYFMYCMVLRCPTLHSIALYSTVYCVAMCYTVLYCTVLCCTVLRVDGWAPF
jgi:hypothetical protein